MGLFSKKYIVEFEYSNSFFGSNKKGTMVVEASSQTSAMSQAKSVLKANFTYVKVLSAHESGGKSEERNVTWIPSSTVTVRETHSSITTSSSNSYAHSTNHVITDKERAYREAERRAKELEYKKLEKERKIESKKKEIKKIQSAPTRNGIIASILSLVAFLLGWIPHWVALAKVKATQNQLQMWVDLGHSKTDSYGQELLADIDKYSKEANSVIWIPFAILVIGVVIIIIVIVVSKKKVPSKLNIARQELENLENN